MLNTKQIKIDDNINLPQYFYFNEKDDKNATGESTFKSKFVSSLDSSCSTVNTDTSVISNFDSFKNEFSGATDTYQEQVFAALNKSKADQPTVLAAAGLLDKATFVDNNDNLKNQIKYLACQNAQMHARTYNSDNFPKNPGLGNVRDFFQRFITLKPYLIVIFFVSMFLYFQGVFGSLDIGYNVATNLFRGETGSNISYWVGLLLGIAIPFLIIFILFAEEICKGLRRQDHYDITNNPFGVKEAPTVEQKNMDYMMVTLFILFIYGFIGVLYTVGSMDKRMNSMILFLVTAVMAILAFFLYIFYLYTPYLTSAGNESTSATQKKKPFQIFVMKIYDADNVLSNQNEDKGPKKVMFYSALIIYVLAMIFFKVQQNNIGLNTWYGSIIKGMTGAGAILVLPILWVLNVVASIKYFYIYPVFLIIARGIRYFGTLLLYKALQTRGIGDRLREAFSDQFLDLMTENHMKEYSPTWGLIGVSLLKSWMNMCGFENKFSKEMVDDSNNRKDISQNKYTSSFIIGRMLMKDNRGGLDMKYTFTILAITAIISSIILFGVEKVQNLTG